jgi:hypothetical protein
LVRHDETQLPFLSDIGTDAAPPHNAAPLPTVEISALCDLNTPIVILEPMFEPGNVSALELIVLNHLVHRLQPKKCFEIGTFDGRSTLNICANAATGARVYTLDLPSEAIDETTHHIEAAERKFIEKESSGARFAGTPYARQIEQIYGDSAQFDFSPFAETVDFVFVDASHSKPNVLSDARSAMQLLRKDEHGKASGMVLFHDYGEWEGVTEALEELAATEQPFQNLRHIQSTSFACLDLT